MWDSTNGAIFAGFRSENPGFGRIKSRVMVELEQIQDRAGRQAKTVCESQSP